MSGVAVQVADSARRPTHDLSMPAESASRDPAFVVAAPSVVDLPRMPPDDLLPRQPASYHDMVSGSNVLRMALPPEKCCNRASQCLGSALGLACSPSLTSSQDERGTVDLPQHMEATFDGFIINGLTNTCSIELIQNTYDEFVHFRPNAFQVPTGGVGNSFVTQLTTYISCFGCAGPYERIAITVVLVYQQLLLQKLCGVRPDSAAA